MIVSGGDQLATYALHNQSVSGTACPFVRLPWPHPCMPKILNRLLQPPSHCKLQVLTVPVLHGPPVCTSLILP